MIYKEKTMDGFIQHKAHPVFPRQTFPVPTLYCAKFLTLQNGDCHSLQYCSGTNHQ